MKIYTRSGDGGDTGLFGGRRVAKHHPRVEAYGTVDELNALLGLAVAALGGSGDKADSAAMPLEPGASVAAVDPAAAASIGPAVAVDLDLRAQLLAIQNRLFDLGADLATPEDGKAGAWLPRADASWAAALEAQIDAMEAGLAPLTTFILPGGGPAAAWLHLARTVCRRAERRAVEAQSTGEDLNPAALVYLNRLSDWLFTAARLANARTGMADTPWRPARV